MALRDANMQQAELAGWATYYDLMRTAMDVQREATIKVCMESIETAQTILAISCGR